MTERRLLRRSDIPTLFASLLAAGIRIIAPIRKDGRISYGAVKSADNLELGEVSSRESAKIAVFPRYEELFRFRHRDRDVEVDDHLAEPEPTVLFGVHPCDAAALTILRMVFTNGSSDPHIESKLDATTVVALSCQKPDEYCFCTSVGGGPSDSRGSDVLLTQLDDERLLVEAVTEKGAALLSRTQNLMPPTDAIPPPAAKLPARFNTETLGPRLAGRFNDAAVWTERSLRCLGCGACAYACPTCSCFDIQSESNRAGGVNLRCWDSCGFGQFTLHASGHNPRARQFERWRQRILHKFSYQPDRLGVLGCVGCGRCSRACPVDMNIAEHVQELAETTP